MRGERSKRLRPFEKLVVVTTAWEPPLADREISNRGRGFRRGRIFFGSGDCFDASSHILYFLVKVENKIHMERLYVDYN